MLCPSVQVAASAVDLPRCEPEPLGELGGRLGRPGQLRHRADLRGERGDKRHRVGAGRESMAQQHERVAPPAGDGCIRHLERVRLDPPAVVAVDRDLGDLIGGIGQQLLAGAGELGEIVRERGHQRADRAPGDPPARGGELVGDELLLLLVLLRFDADDLDAAAKPPADRVEQLLTAHTAGMAEHESRAIRRVREIAERFVDERVGALLDAIRPQKTGLIEQRRTRKRDELARKVLARVDLGHLEVGILRTQQIPQSADGAVGEEIGRPADQHDGRRTRAIPLHLGDDGLDRCLRRRGPRRHARKPNRRHRPSERQRSVHTETPPSAAETRSMPCSSVRNAEVPAPASMPSSRSVGWP